MEYFVTAYCKWLRNGDTGTVCEGSVRFIITDKSGEGTVRDLYEEMIKQAMVKFNIGFEPTIVRWTFHPNNPLSTWRREQ